VRAGRIGAGSIRQSLIEGVSGEELGKGLNPKAPSHRVRRAIQRLNRAFKKSGTRTIDRAKGPPE
jgi:hypothetical protein